MAESEPSSDVADAADAAEEVDTRQAQRSEDPLVALRDEIASLDEVPVRDRVPRLERANDVLAAALAELDEV